MVLVTGSGLAAWLSTGYVSFQHMVEFDNCLLPEVAGDRQALLAGFHPWTLLADFWTTFRYFATVPRSIPVSRLYVIRLSVLFLRTLILVAVVVFSSGSLWRTTGWQHMLFVYR